MRRENTGGNRARATQKKHAINLALADHIADSPFMPKPHKKKLRKHRRHAIALLWATAAAWRGLVEGHAVRKVADLPRPATAWSQAVFAGYDVGIDLLLTDRVGSLMALCALKQVLGVNDIHDAKPRANMTGVIAQAIELVKAGDVDPSEGKDGDA